MPPQAYMLAGALVWNYQRDRGGKVTLSQWARSHPFLFIAGACWLVPHVLVGSHVTDRAVRVLDRLR